MRRIGLRRRRRVPWMRPTELRDCGAAAFASVAWAAGHEVSVEEARDLVRTDNNGTHLVGLIHGGRTIGLESRAAREHLRRPSHDRWLGDRAPRPRSGPLRRAPAMDAPWAVGDGPEPRPHVHAPRRLRAGVQPLRRRIPADRRTAATPLACRAGSRRAAARRARCGVVRARRQLRGGRGRAPPRITAGARARLRSRAPGRRLDRRSPSWLSCWSASAPCKR